METRLIGALLVTGIMLGTHGNTFSLDLRIPRHVGGAVGRLMSAAPAQTDGVLRAFDLDAGVADVGDVAVGDELKLTLFEDVALTLTLKEKMPSPLGGDVFIAEASGYEGVKNAVVLRTADGLVVDVQDYLNKRVYKVISTADGVMVQEIEPKSGGRCGCDTLKRPVSGGAQPSAATKSARRQLFGDRGTGDTYVDILVAYEQNAATWVKSYGGGTTNFAQTAVQKMNVALANVGLDSSFRFRLVGVMETTTSSRDLEYVLESVESGVRGWNAVKTKRDEVGADIATVLVDTGSAYGMVGLGWSLEEDTFDGFSETAFNACSIRAVAQDHTMTHEVGHNMGCGHSDVQETQPGPQMYEYSAGYYFSVGDEKFHTIMAYSGEGPGGKEAPYFSSPNHTYRGVAVGDASHDNARTLANTFAVAAGWRDSSTGEISGGGDEPADEFFYDNDDFSSAKELIGASGKISGSTVDAIGDIGEFLAKKYMSRHTVWYKWTAESDGQLGVEVETADFDTVMAAFTGSSASSLTTVAYNDDKAKNDNLSAVSFDVRQGVTYHICLGGYMAERGDFRLKWNLTGYAMLSVVVADGCDGMGTVSGGNKGIKSGAKVALKATANKGYVFTGWYVGGEPLMGEGDYRSASYSYVATDEPVTIEARFASTEDDIASLQVNVTNATTAADGTISLGLSECVESLTLPKLSVSGLPSGVKYDAKTMTISGKATKPGMYAVKVSATNMSVKKATPASTGEFTLTVPNLASDVLPNLDPATGAYGMIMCGVAFDPDLVDCAYDDSWTVKVSGLPSGLKWDAKTGTITGIPTKAGTNTVTFTVSKKGEKSQIATITLMTAALPTWAQGTFAGYVRAYGGEPDYEDRYGSATMTVSSVGKISGKISLDGTNWTFSAASYVRSDGGDYFEVEAEAKAGKVTMPMWLMVHSEKDGHPNDVLINSAVEGWLGGSNVATASLWRNMWKDKDSSVAAKAEIAKWEGVYTISIEDGGYLSLTVGKNGDVKVAGKLSDGTSVSATAPLMFNECWGFFTFVWASPSTYKGGYVWFHEIRLGTERGPFDGAVVVSSRNPQATGEYGAGFTRHLAFDGAYYDKGKNLSNYYDALRLSIGAPEFVATYKLTTLDENNRKITLTESSEPDVVDTFEQEGMTVSVNENGQFVVAQATKPVQDKETKVWSYNGPNDGALTLSFAQATGIFKGSYTFWYDYTSAYDETTGKATQAHTSKKVSFEGIMVQGKESLCGFYLWDAAGVYEDAKTGKEKTYKYKESHSISLDAQ